MDAVKSGRSPRKYLRAPSEVENAVNAMKTEAYHVRNSSGIYGVQDKDVFIDPYVLYPNKVTATRNGAAARASKPLFQYTEKASRQKDKYL